MYKNGYATKVFRDVFPDYETFKEYYLNSGLSDGEEDVPNKKTFTLILFEYSDSHLCLSEESFKQKFSNDIYTFYKEFERTTKSIDELMNLTDQEIAKGDILVTNYADIPENESSTDIEEVDFITSQQKMINKKGILQVKKEQLSNKRVYTVKTFLNRFRHLFIKIISPAYTFVIEENEEE